MDTAGPISANAHFNRQYQTHLKHLKLKGLQPKTIDAYARAIRHIGDYFSHDIVTVEEAQRLFGATRTLCYRVFFFILYSLGLRLSEGLALKVGDIDGERGRVHIRDSKGNRDRFVPLPEATLEVLRKFWLVHRHPELLFPNRAGGLAAASRAPSPLDRGGVQNTLRQVALDCGLKKRSRHTACATAMQPT